MIAPIKATFTANGTILIPKGYMIASLAFRETANQAVTGGVRIGTTDGGTQVAVAVAVGGLALGTVLDSALLLRYFSATADTTLYVQAVVLWSGASVNLTVQLVQGP